MLGSSRRAKGEKTSFLSHACSEYIAAGMHPESKTKLDKALKRETKRTEQLPHEEKKRINTPPHHEMKAHEGTNSHKTPTPGVFL